jgi:hypothetical protein
MKKPALKKWHIVVSGIILLFIIILFATPRIARWYIVKNGPELIGRKILIDKIRINYFTGKLRIKDVSMFEADGSTTFASFSQLKVNVDYLPLLRNEIVVKYISLADPYVQVLQDGSRFNFSDLITADSTEQESDNIKQADTISKAVTIPEEPLKYIINNISITNGYVKYTDISLDHTIALDSLDLTIPGFTWNSDSTNFGVDFRFVDGGGLYSNLSLNQSDSTYSIILGLDSINLGIVEPYIKNSLNISSIEGYLSSDLLIKGSISSILQLFVHGVNNIYGFQLQDTLNRTVFSFNDLTIGLDTFQLDKNRIRIDSITLKDPYIYFELIDTTNNWLAMIKSSPATKPDSLSKTDSPGQTDSLYLDSSAQQSAETSDSSKSFSYNFPRLAITGGTIVFSDKTLSYPFEYKIENLNIESSESPENQGKLSLKVMAGLNGKGTLRTNATVNPVNLNDDMKLSLEIGQFRMKDVDSYFKDYFGFPVKGGIMNFKTDNTMIAGTLESNNNIYFRGFTLNDKLEAESRFKVPLRLAIGVLSDKDGIIDLKAPVKMTGDEVKIKNLARIIFRVIGNLFIKAAVSPYNLLAGLYEADPESLKMIELGLTEMFTDEKKLKTVDIIADILNDKPRLDVDFIYCINQAKAADSLAYILTVEDYMNKNTAAEAYRRQISDSTLIRYLLNKPYAASLPANSGLDILCRNYIGSDNLKVRLDSLRSYQTGIIKNYLSVDRTIPSERFRVIGATPDSLLPDVKYPSFRIYFTAGE